MDVNHPKPRKIRVCHLASGDLWAGAEVQVANVCRGLIDTGMVEVSAVVLNNGRLAKELQSLGTGVTVIDEQGNTWWQILWRLTHYLRSRPVDILHTHRYKENILGCMAAKISGVTHVVRTVHGSTELSSGWKGVKAKLYKAIDKIVCRYFVSYLIAVSRDISGHLERTFPGKIIIHIPNCIDERRLVPTTGREEKRLELGLRPSEFVIGTVGRLNPVKGTEYLIRAVPEIVKRREDVRVLVVGDGPLRGDLEALVQFLGLEKTVTFLGWRDDSVDIINALDLFVLPSVHEGMPTVLLEAMSLGVPVVASNTGGIPDIVADNWSGILPEPRNESSLAAKCMSVISDRSLADLLVHNASRGICKYHVTETAVPLLTLYQRLSGSSLEEVSGNDGYRAENL